MAATHQIPNLNASSVPSTHFSSSPWFVRPLSLLWVGLALAIIPAATSNSIQHANWDITWYVSTRDYVLVLFSGTMIGAGILLTSGRPAPLHDRLAIAKESRKALSHACNLLLVLLCIGYAVWTASAVVHGLTLKLAVSLFLGNDGEANFALRNALVTVPGISTLTEVGPVLLSALVVLWKLGIHRPRAITLILVLATVRAFLNSERLSLIEVVVPLVLMIGLLVSDTHDPSVRRARRRVLGMIAVLPVLIFGFFIVTEQLRSWGHYEDIYSGSIISFSADRIWAYYATALNNGVIYRQFFAPILPYPAQTLALLTNAPIIGEFISQIGIPSVPLWSSALTQYGNPEFNNQSGLLPIIGEVGIVPAVFLFLLWGVGIGTLYRLGTRGNVAALCGYAGMAMGLIELARYPYYLSGRMVPGLIAILILFLFLRNPKPASVHKYVGSEYTRRSTAADE